MEIDDLLEFSEISSSRNSLRQLAKKHKPAALELEMIELSLKNSFYNRNRIQEECDRTNAGFKKFTNEENLELCKKFGIKPGESKEVKVETTIIADIFTFEFTSFMINIIRFCNFIVSFKMKAFDNYSRKTAPTITRYYTGRLNSEIKTRNEVHFLILCSYEDWIGEANELRNEVVHEYVQPYLYGDMIMRRHRVSEDKATYEAFMRLSLLEHNIDDLIVYCDQILEKAVSTYKQFLAAALVSASGS